MLSRNGVRSVKNDILKFDIFSFENFSCYFVFEQSGFNVRREVSNLKTGFKLETDLETNRNIADFYYFVRTNPRVFFLEIRRSRFSEKKHNQ